MGALSSKLRRAKHARGISLLFWCPGCDSVHRINVEGDQPLWSWDGDVNNPTFSPSILVTYSGSDAGQEDALPERCHSFVRAGQIEFLGDSTHALSGQTVSIPDWPALFHDGDQTE